MMDLKKYNKFVSVTEAKKQLLDQEISDLTKLGEIYACNLGHLETALQAMNTVGILVQREFKGVIEELVTQALQYVYGPTHSFEIESKVARSQPEMYMYLVIDGERFSPRDEEVSGGQADVVAFALRVILWAMQQDRTRPTLIFDEPFRNLGNSHHAQAIGEMLTYISDMLGLQFLIVTHNSGIVTSKMTRYNVTMTKGVSTVEKVEALTRVE